MDDTRLRIGAVSYLNAVPLTYALRQAARVRDELTYAEPSTLAEQLRRGEISVGLIPTMEYLAGTGECVVPEVSISSCGPATSVKLFSNKPWDEVRIVAAHGASRSSAALAKVLLQEQYGHEVELRRMAPDVDEMLRAADAALLIGDPCLAAADVQVARTVDLGTLWHNLTGLPFVYALWVVGKRKLAPSLTQALVKAKWLGVLSIDNIARQEAGRAGLTQAQIERYLGVDLNYDLTPAHIDGIRTFAELCVRHGLVEQVREIRFA